MNLCTNNLAAVSNSYVLCVFLQIVAYLSDTLAAGGEFPYWEHSGTYGRHREMSAQSEDSHCCLSVCHETADEQTLSHLVLRMR